MEVIALGTKYNLASPLYSAGEGEIYSLTNDSVAKIYWPDIQTRDRKLKVLALCNSFANNLSEFGGDSFAFPEAPTYDKIAVFDHICGFTMKYFNNVEKLDLLGYDLKNNSFKESGGFVLTDNTALDFAFNLFELISKLHTSRIILGDVNGGNILIDKKSSRPIIVDIDSSQFGQFKCIAYTEEYLDPLIELQGRNLKGGFEYNTESDVFALTCLIYEFLVGVNPFFFNNDKGHSVVESKRLGISFLSFIHHNTNMVNGCSFTGTLVNRNIQNRVDQVKKISPKIYEYFISILVHGERSSLLQTLQRDDPRHPAYIFYSQSGFDSSLRDWKVRNEKQKITVNQQSNSWLPDSGFSKIIIKDIPEKIEFIQRERSLETEDPAELKQFLSNYKISLNELILS